MKIIITIMAGGAVFTLLAIALLLESLIVVFEFTTSRLTALAMLIDEKTLKLYQER